MTDLVQVPGDEGTPSSAANYADPHNNSFLLFRCRLKMLLNSIADFLVSASMMQENRTAAGFYVLCQEIWMMLFIRGLICSVALANYYK